MRSFSLTSQHSGGQTTVHTVSNVCVITSRIDTLLTPSVHFVPHVLDSWWDVWYGIVLQKGHVPSLSTDKGQHVRSNNFLRVGVCIQIAINNDQGCPAMRWDATPHHHTPTAKRTSLSNACILVALAHPAVHHNPTIWMIHTKSRFFWEQYSFPFYQTPPQMDTWPP